ncbi:MAG TPA: hypothetical protein VI215_03520 [Bacteroidota bacterium]|jgi:hypothetical protein
MKIFVIHDRSGNIRGTLASDRAGVDIKSSHDGQVHAFEKTDLKKSDLPGYLHDLHTKHKVDLTSEKPRIVPRGV